MTLYAKTTLQHYGDIVRFNLGESAERCVRIPKYRATIEVEFEGDIPEKIMQIMRTGVFE